MDRADKPRPSGKKPILVVVLAFAVVAVVFLGLLTNSSVNPRVTGSFLGITNTHGRPEALFSFTNESSLIVHLVAHSTGNLVWPCQAETILPGQSATYRINNDAGPKFPFPQDDSASAVARPPVKIDFHFRRQDTALEEAREMLDSVLQSVSLKLPGLNQGSEHNEFSISLTVFPERRE